RRSALRRSTPGARPGARSGRRAAGGGRGTTGRAGLAFAALDGGSARAGGVVSGAAARFGSGATPCVAKRHNARSSLLGGRPAILDQHDMEAARPVRAELDALLDVAGARRPGDEIDGARHRPVAVGLALSRAELRPAFLIGRDHLV